MKRFLAFGLAALAIVTWGPVAPAQTCTFSLSASSQNFNSLGGTNSFAVNTTNDCAWTASSSAVWITIIDGATGVGTGVVSYSVERNFSPVSRTGTLTVADQTNTISQTGSRAVICPVKLSGVLAFSDDDETLVRARLGKRDLVEEPANRLAIELDPDARTLRLIEIDEDDDEVSELAVSARCVFLPGNLFAGDLLFDALPVYNEAADLDFVGDGSLQIRGKFATDTSGLPRRVTGKLIGVLNDPVNGSGDGPAAMFKGVISPGGRSFTP